MIAQRPRDLDVPFTHVMGVARFERLFRITAGLDVDKSDLKRYREETEGQFPEIVGGLSVALARSLKIVDPDLKNQQGTRWQRVIAIFDLLV
jgi:Domain of unknown function (DUF1931)